MRGIPLPSNLYFRGVGQVKWNLNGDVTFYFNYFFNPIFLIRLKLFQRRGLLEQQTERKSTLSKCGVGGECWGSPGRLILKSNDFVKNQIGANVTLCQKIGKGKLQYFGHNSKREGLFVCFYFCVFKIEHNHIHKVTIISSFYITIHF